MVAALGRVNRVALNLQSQYVKFGVAMIFRYDIVDFFMSVNPVYKIQRFPTKNMSAIPRCLVHQIRTTTYTYYYSYVTCARRVCLSVA